MSDWSAVAELSVTVAVDFALGSWDGVELGSGVWVGAGVGEGEVEGVAVEVGADVDEGT